MVVLTRELVQRTVEDWEQKADVARLARDYSELARFRFRAVWFRELLAGAPRAEGDRGASGHVMDGLYRSDPR